MNWNRTVKTKIKNQEIDIIIFFDSDDDGNEKISFKAMLNEYFLSFDMFVNDRDLAYSLIQNFPIKTLNEKFLQLAYENGAVG